MRRVVKIGETRVPCLPTARLPSPWKSGHHPHSLPRAVRVVRVVRVGESGKSGRKGVWMQECDGLQRRRRRRGNGQTVAGKSLREERRLQKWKGERKGER